MTIDDESIAAFVDGELDAIGTKRVEKAMADDPALTEHIARLKSLRGTLSAHFDPVLTEPVPDRLTALLANVDTSMTHRRDNKFAAPIRRFAVTQWGSMAAALALGLFVGNYALRGPQGPVSASGDTLIASGPLASALDTKLASAQGAGDDIRIGLSFRDSDGTACRSFESNAVTGIACHQDSNWQLRQTFSGKNSSQYRQASSGQLAEAVASMIDGAPLDAQAEMALRDKGWK